MIRDSRYWPSVFGLSVLASILGAQTFAPVGFAQAENFDRVSRINGEPTGSAGLTYFNAENCEDAAGTTYDLTLDDAEGVNQAFLWAGIENAGCEQFANRSDLSSTCREVAGNPRVVVNATMADLTLGALVDTGIVDCENTALTGEVYWIYSFRSEDPGSTDVATEGYGIAPIVVDVVPPAELNITSAPEQTGSVFSVSWSTPIDAPNLERYNLYASSDDDAEDALSRDPVATAPRNSTSISVSAEALGLDDGEEAYLFVTAVDEAAVTAGGGNEGPPSVATRGIAGAGGTGGAGGDAGGGGDGAAGVGGSETPDGGGGGGCSAARTSPIGAAASLLGFIVAALWVRKRFRIT